MLEDINEHPFPSNACCCSCITPGSGSAIRPLLLGSFSGSAPNDYDAGYSEEMIDFIRSRLISWQIAGFRISAMTANQHTLPLGARAHLVPTIIQAVG